MATRTVLNGSTWGVAAAVVLSLDAPAAAGAGLFRAPMVVRL